MAGTQKTKGIFVDSINTAFHNYILEWDSLEYRVFVDTTHYFTFKNEKTGFEAWPFDKKFHLLLNVAVGGNWGAVKGVDSTCYPQKMVVDFVRVYTKNK